jgi:predicted RNA-binding Zn-ribbon protein involved in translation (DUF1610 family)
MERLAAQPTGFLCPLCGAPTHSAAEIGLKNGRRLKADFYHCPECSLHFVHPERFIRSVTPAANES